MTFFDHKILLLLLDEFKFLRNYHNYFEGRLVYRICDGVFFLMVGTEFINKGHMLFGGDKPQAKINQLIDDVNFQAHITLNKGMKKKQGELILEEWVNIYGIAEQKISHHKDIICLNKIIEFEIIGIYEVIRKTPKYTIVTKQLHIQSTELASLNEQYNLQKNKEAYFHITFSQIIV
ncbi:hypothetical protein EF513_05485 [Rickettsiales endosymbiont of Stachyamoeba lipophora]|nr:hypothetical protein EF513_05485 [Rickettsiales endosymbiont of Stachyamoeba lipophora]